MPRYIEIDDDDDDLGGYNNDPAQDTPLVKQLRKQLKDAQKLANEAADRATKAEKSVRQRTVADVLKEKGANPGLARYVLQDLEDPTPESVSSWLAEQGELFGYKPQTPSDPAQAMGLPAGTELPPDLVAAYQRFTNGQTTGVHTDPVDATLAAVQNAQSADELLALIAAAQAG